MLKKLLFWVVMTFLFVFGSTVLLIAAVGYRVNWLNFSVHETSLVWLKGSDKNVIIYLDGKKVGNRLPYRINYVDIGWKELVIKKNGYSDWEKSFYVDEGRAYEFRDIVFFKKDSVPEKVSDQFTKDLLNNVVTPINIVVTNGELLANDNLVSRFSTDPVAYAWYKDGKHIIYQINDEIRVIDTAGENDNLLIKLSSKVPSVFRLIDSGKYLLYKDGDGVFRVKIR